MIRDDFASDLANVFYDDVNTRAMINGEEVTGYLTKGDSDFGMDAETYVFDGPASALKDVSRGDAVQIDNLTYHVVRPDFDNDRIKLVLAL